MWTGGAESYEAVEGPEWRDRKFRGEEGANAADSASAIRSAST